MIYIYDRYMVMSNKRKMSIWLLLLAVAAFLPSARADMQANRIRQSLDRKITELMIMAQQARNSGNMVNAELFWVQARELRPSIPRPSWLNRQPDTGSEQPVLSMEDRLRRIASLPYCDAKLLLDELLVRNPGNKAVRRLYLKMAEQNSDHAEFVRHNSILNPGKQAGWGVHWYFVAAFLCGLFIWQTIALYRDFTR